MPLKLKKLRDQVIVITGASSGIGLATAEAAVAKGASVVLAARSINVLQQIVDRFVAAGGRAIAVECDVSERAQLEQLAQAAIVKFGRIDTWINNAGQGLYARLDEVTEQDARRLFDINYWGLVNGSIIALPHLKKQGGALINLGSEVSEAYVPMLGTYSATKHAVKGFTDTLRVEVESVDRAPVSITLIQPTAVDTEFARHACNYQHYDADLPASRIEAAQVADAILKAAVRPRRQVKVGMNARLNTFMANAIPSLADSMVAEQVDKQHSEVLEPRPEGILYQPTEVVVPSGQPRSL